MGIKYYFSDLEYGPEEEKAVFQVLKSRWLTMGPRTQEFERAFSRLLDGTACALVSSGTTALHLGLRVLGVGPGDEVILPSLTFVATANVAQECGARCVFADIEEMTVPLLCPRDTERKITKRTRVIMPVHYAGFSVNMRELQRIVEKERSRRKKAGESRPLYIVEDAAHAVGARDSEGQALGTIGDIGCFSLFSNKNIATGEGGVIAARDEGLLKRIKLLRSHGLTRQTWERHTGGFIQEDYLYDLVEPGYNYRPTEITAALGLAQMKKLSRINKKRASLFRYAHKILKNIKGILLPFSPPEKWGAPSCHLLPILLEDPETRVHTSKVLLDAGIQTSQHYRPVHTMSFYRKNLPRGKRSLALTEDYAAREMTLPLHTRLEKGDMEAILQTLKKALS
jgi:dTDP-4-amino-4,6-dideoxygalactose transaminase